MIQYQYYLQQNLRTISNQKLSYFKLTTFTLRVIQWYSPATVITQKLATTNKHIIKYHDCKLLVAYWGRPPRWVEHRNCYIYTNFSHNYQHNGYILRQFSRTWISGWNCHDPGSLRKGSVPCMWKGQPHTSDPGNCNGFIFNHVNVKWKESSVVTLHYSNIFLGKEFRKLTLLMSQIYLIVYNNNQLNILYY